MLTEDAIDEYLKPLTDEQAANIRHMRALVHECCPDLLEEVDAGKWFVGLLTYSTPDGHFMFALGPRTGGQTTFHMHPYYCLPALQERHGAVLKPVLTGKSCIRFKKVAQVPEDALRDILAGVPETRKLSEELANRKPKPRG